jgi:hypothetical protein
MPYYPKTSAEGVAHFISYSTPLLPENCTSEQAYAIAKAEISKVCVQHMPSMRQLAYFKLDSVFYSSQDNQYD